jgi:two-component system, cell cycle sensor histidine kinase and response regulator CckA
MGKPLRVLLVEDSEDDAQLVVDQLERCGWDVTFDRVDTAEAMSACLDSATYDLILSDYNMPRFSAPEAVALWKARGLDSPFMVVTGSIGEEHAVEVLKAGAHDFFLKDRMSRFCTAVERELREAESRRTLQRSEREREEAVQSLRRSERLFHDLFESAPDATVIIDGQGVIRAASRHAERLFGYDRADMIGRSIEMLVPAAAAAAYREATEPSAHSGEPRLMGAGQQHLLGQHKDGSTFPVEISASPMTTESGTMIAAIRDITDRRRLEDQYRQAQKMEAVGRLAGGIAHDFNNILGVILGHSEIMHRRLPAADPLRARVEQILTASERAAGLTRQLLAFSRKQVLAARVLDVNAVVEGMTDMLARLLGEDVELTFRPGEGLGRIRADSTQIEQIFMNLAINAHDAMPGGGRLSIETANADMDAEYARVHAGARPGAYVCLTVTDSGHGMTKEVQARVFEPFYTTKEAGKGTGLGLATVYGIVKQSEGFIYVYSEPGQGTTFKIYFPRVEGEPQRTVEPAPVSRGSETVLLVEDEEILRALVHELLESSGYRVIVASDPAHALEAAAQHEGDIHLLLTDVVMPGMNGRELARQVKERRPGLRVLYMSGYTEDAIAHRGVLDTGAFLISKPFSQDTLARRLREALDPSA